MSNRESQSQPSGVPAVCVEAPPRGALAALLVEDSSHDVEFIVRALQNGGYLPVWWRQVVDDDGMKRALVEETWDVVVSDHRIWAFNSFKALSVLAASGVAVPLIMFTGPIRAETAIDAFRAGAADLVSEDDYDELGRAVSRCLRRKGEDRRALDANVQAVHENEECFRAPLEMLIDPFVLLRPLRDNTGEIFDFVYEYANNAAYYSDGGGEDLIGISVLERLAQLVPVVPFHAFVTVVETGEPLALDDFARPSGLRGGPNQRFFDVRALKAGEVLLLTWRDVTKRDRHATIVR